PRPKPRSSSGTTPPAPTLNAPSPRSPPRTGAGSSCATSVLPPTTPGYTPAAPRSICAPCSGTASPGSTGAGRSPKPPGPAPQPVPTPVCTRPTPGLQAGIPSPTATDPRPPRRAHRTAPFHRTALFSALLGGSDGLVYAVDCSTSTYRSGIR